MLLYHFMKLRSNQSLTK